MPAVATAVVPVAIAVVLVAAPVVVVTPVVIATIVVLPVIIVVARIVIATVIISAAIPIGVPYEPDGQRRIVTISRVTVVTATVVTNWNDTGG